MDGNKARDLVELLFGSEDRVPASTPSDRPTPVLPAEEPAEPEVPPDAGDNAVVGVEADAEDLEVGLLAMWLFYIPAVFIQVSCL